MARLREGRANTARGAAHFLRETVARVRAAGASGQLTVRADSGFYNHAVVAVCRKQDLRFSITIRQQPMRRLIEAIPEEDWTPIPYWLPGGADVAETTYTPPAHGGRHPGAAPCGASSRRPAHSSRSSWTTATTLHQRPRGGDDGARDRAVTPRSRTDPRPQVRRRAQPSPLGPLRRERGMARAGDRDLARWTARLGLGEGIVTTRTLRRRYFSLAGRLTHSARGGPCTSRRLALGRAAGSRARATTGDTAPGLTPAHSAGPARLAPACPRTPRAPQLPRPQWSRACSLRHRPANTDTPAELSGIPAASLDRCIRGRETDAQPWRAPRPCAAPPAPPRPPAPAAA